MPSNTESKQIKQSINKWPVKTLVGPVGVKALWQKEALVTWTHLHSVKSPVKTLPGSRKPTMRRFHEEQEAVNMNLLELETKRPSTKVGFQLPATWKQACFIHYSLTQ